MPEVTFAIAGYSSRANKILVDPTAIDGKGDLAYPRLSIPVSLELHPVESVGMGTEKHYILMAGPCRLSLEGVEISDAASTLEPTHISTYVNSTSCVVDFPLDQYRLRFVEEKRKDDLDIAVHFNFLTAISEGLPVQRQGQSPTLENFLTSIKTTSVRVDRIKIPQSHWVRNVLPKLGVGEYFIVELPRGKKTITDAWDYLDRAETAFRSWEAKSVCAHCREMGTSLDQAIRAQHGDTSFVYAVKWKRAYDQFSHFASLYLHLEDLKKSNKFPPASAKIVKADVEHILIVSKSLMKYAEEILAPGSKALRDHKGRIASGFHPMVHVTGGQERKCRRVGSGHRRHRLRTPAGWSLRRDSD